MTDAGGLENSISVDTVDAARRRDPDAIVTVYRALSSAVYTYLLRQVRNPTAAEDLTAEVFCEVLAAIERFEGTPERLRAWVFRIARNTLIDHVRKESRRRHESIDEVAEVADLVEFRVDPEAETLALLEREQIIRMVRELPPDQRDVVLLRLVADLPLADVAYLLHKSVGAVKALQHRALRRLGRALGLEPERELQLVQAAEAIMDGAVLAVTDGQADAMNLKEAPGRGLSLPG